MNESRSAIAPHDEYRRLHAQREAHARRLGRLESYAGNGRVVAFVAILIVGYWIATTGDWHLPWLAGALIAFAAFFVWRRRVVQSLDRASRGMGYFRRTIARLDDRWASVGPSGERYSSSEHRYAKDLDLFGHGSLFQLLCDTPTLVGQDTLAAWLCEGADSAAICARQAAVEELRNRIDLREAIALFDREPQHSAKQGGLAAWIASKPQLTGRLRPAIAVILSVVSITFLVRWLFFDGRWSWVMLVGLVQALFIRSIWRQIKTITAKLDDVVEELNLLAQTIRLIEAEKFACPMLRDIAARLHLGAALASSRVAQLSRLVDTWETITRNKFVIPFATILMLPLHLAYAIERWRTRNGKAACDWRAAAGEFESLCCLAGYAYEHPQQPFPTIVDTGPCLEVEQLGHPLIPASRRVTNDLRLGAEPRLLLVTGSNMSGKSTFLRSIGTNVVLALAGAPVCAARMIVSPLALATAMRTADSLQDGVSSFYAEIKRLRMVCDLAADRPILFMLDEILHGTNSHDRRLGAQTVIKILLSRGAIGLVTTHDLALAEIAVSLDRAALNVHFEDQLDGDRISFDYKLRPGVVPKGNGLVLMRLLGFDVQPE